MRDESDRYLWLLLLMVVLGIGVPSLGRLGTSAPAAQPAENGRSSGGLPAGAAVPGQQSTEGVPELFDPLADLFGCDRLRQATTPTRTEFEAWFRACRLGDAARHRKAIVAVVPDPLDSMFEHTFDRVLEAIDRAAENAGYLRDRYYLPWQTDRKAQRRDRRSGSPPEGGKHERTPGLLVFRTACHAGTEVLSTPAGPPCEPGFLAILLVGETSTWGIHHAAMQRALEIADAITTDNRNERMLVLGPTFSGSISSLRAELEHYACVMQHRGFAVVTGSATNARNRDVMSAPRRSDLVCRDEGQFPPEPFILYSAMVTDDDATTQRFYVWLTQNMGVTVKPGPAGPCMLDGVGILAETDTVYARSFAERPGGGATDSQLSPSECDGRDPSHELSPELVIRYPSRLTHLRSISERSRKPNAPQTQLPIEDPQRMLDLSLGESDEPAEALPAFSDKTQFSDELVLAGSLKAMCRSDLRFLGIIGTDIIDRLFLARQARRYCPNLRLFTIETDVLFAHPNVRDEMNGTLIVSPYPLFPQNGAWTPRSALGTIAPFGDSTAQGVYNAALRLLGAGAHLIVDTLPPLEASRHAAVTALQTLDARPRPPPFDNEMPVWVSAAGNGTLWPVEMLDSSYVRCHSGIHADHRDCEHGLTVREGALGTPGQWKWAFGAIWLACMILAAGYWSGRHAPRSRFATLVRCDVFRPAAGRRVEHALFSCLALLPVTCAYLASAALVFADRVLQDPQHAALFTGSLLGALRGAIGEPQLELVVATWILLAAACIDALIMPVVTALATRLSGGSSHARLLRYALWSSTVIVTLVVLARAHGLVFSPERWITLRERAINASSGLSPLLPAWLFAAALFLAARAQLVRLHGEVAHAHDDAARVRGEVAFGFADPMASCGHPAVDGMDALRKRMLATLRDFAGARWIGAAVAVAAVTMWLFGGIPRAMTTLEGAVWTWPLSLAAAAAATLALASYIPFLLGWRGLHRYLRRHANLPGVEAFSRLAGRAAHKMSEIFVKSAPLTEKARALQQLRVLSSQVPAIRLELDPGLRADLERAMRMAAEIQDALGPQLAQETGYGGPGAGGKAVERLHEVAVTLARVLATQWGRAASNDELTATSANLRKLAAEPGAHALPTVELYERAGADETQVWLRLAEEFVAAHSAGFFHEVLARLRGLLTSATATMVLLLVGLSSYPFERQPMLLFVIQCLVVAMVVGTIAVMVGMENSEVLSRIRKIEGGKVTWNRSFILRIAFYGLVPMLSVVATQLPSVGGALFGWLPALFGVLQ